MKKVLLALIFTIWATTVAAGVRCHTNSLGVERCSGTDSNGNRVSTTTRTDSLGRTHTTGAIGDKNVKFKRQTDSAGNVNIK